jgi:hypothetical protein
MKSKVRNVHPRLVLGGLLAALVLSACGSGPKVGDCIDSQKQVVDCKSPNATLRLVSNQSGPRAIACIEINDKPQISVKVGGGTFCAESVSGSQ